MKNRQPLFAVLILAAVALGGCDQLGIETPDKVAARQEAEGKAIGGGCRHSGRALEECYEMNRRFLRSAVYAGWREMDVYMRENNIAAMKPVPEEADQAALAPKAEGRPAEGKKSAAEVVSKPVLEKPIDGVGTDKSAKVAVRTS